MSAVDIVIIIILLWGAYRGWKSGLVKEILSTCGFAVGMVVASLLYKTVGEYLTPSLGSGSVASFASCVIAFIVIWVVVPILCGVAATLLTKVLKGLSMGLLNSLMGCIIGVAKYFILVSVVFSAMDYVGIISPEKRDASTLYPYVTMLGKTFFGDSTIAEESGQLKDDTVYIKVDHNKDKSIPNGGKPGK